MTVCFTRYAELKFEVLETHGFKVMERQVEDAVTTPEKVTPGKKGRLIAQRAISETHLLRVVYEQDKDVITVVTFYPARRRRYEAKV